ncbi:MAG: biopolymer transporter ExbD [Akkermansiaceae bacterium]
MKLNLTVPERPGLIFFIPGFDFLVLVLALVMLTGVAARESYVDISLPRSEFRGSGLGGEQPVIIEVRYSGKGTSFYIGRNLVEEENLAEVIQANAEELSTRTVLLRIDQSAPLWVEQKLADLCIRLDLSPKRGIRTEELSAP